MIYSVIVAHQDTPYWLSTSRHFFVIGLLSENARGRWLWTKSINCCAPDLQPTTHQLFRGTKTADCVARTGTCSPFLGAVCLLALHNKIAEWRARFGSLVCPRSESTCPTNGLILCLVDYHATWTLNFHECTNFDDGLSQLAQNMLLGPK